MSEDHGQWQSVAFGAIFMFPVSLLEFSEAVSRHSPGICSCEGRMLENRRPVSALL